MTNNMDKKTTFVAVEDNGLHRTFERWKKADILLLVEMLKARRKDLYVELQIHLAVSYRQMNLDSIQCEEPPPFGEYQKKGAKASQGIVSFNSTLTSEQLNALTALANEFSVFASPLPLKKEALAAFFRCERTSIKVRNLRLLCAMMSALSNYGHIGRYWQAPIYKNRLLLAYEKDGYINRSDLTTANHAMNNVLMDERIAKIIKIIRDL